MNRRIFFLGLTGLAGCTGASRPRLNVFNWSSYVAHDTISGFEREFGVRIRYGVYESNEEMLAKVLTGNSGWDVVFPSNYFIQPMRENELLAPLDPDKLTNLGSLEPAYRTPEWDPKLEWSVPYMWGGSGILFNRRVEPDPRGWADMWNDRNRGRITMLDDPGEVLGASLKRLGHSLNSTDENELRAAQREAIAQKRLLRAYLNAEVRDQAVAGDVLMAQLWATTSEQAIAEASQLAFVYPAEGFALYADNAVILRESRRDELAHEFINYLLRPSVAAAIVLETLTATPNGDARRLLPGAAGSNPTLYPPPEVLARGEWFRPLPGPTQKLRDRLWTEIKSS
jgi:spermidine/putrescine transport system substrate-binding protein